MKNPRIVYLLFVSLVLTTAIVLNNDDAILIGFMSILLSIPVWTYFTAKKYGLKAKTWAISSMFLTILVIIALAIRTRRMDKEEI